MAQDDEQDRSRGWLPPDGGDVPLTPDTTPRGETWPPQQPAESWSEAEPAEVRGFAAPAGAGPSPAAPGPAPAGPWAQPPQPSNGKATASLVLGVLGLLFCPLICSVAAHVLGYNARREIDASNGTQGGRGLATAGIVTGWVGLVFGILIVVALIGLGAQVEDGELDFGEPAWLTVTALLGVEVLVLSTLFRA